MANIGSLEIPRIFLVSRGVREQNIFLVSHKEFKTEKMSKCITNMLRKITLIRLIFSFFPSLTIGRRQFIFLSGSGQSWNSMGTSFFTGCFISIYVIFLTEYYSQFLEHNFSCLLSINLRLIVVRHFYLILTRKIFSNSNVIVYSCKTQ